MKALNRRKRSAGLALGATLSCVAVLGAAPAALGADVTNPADHPAPIKLTIDGQTYQDGLDTLPGYDDYACTAIPNVQYDFADDEIHYYDGDGELIKSVHWTEWSRISSYATWAKQQKGGSSSTPTTSTPSSSPSTSAPSSSGGGSSSSGSTPSSSGTQSGGSGTSSPSTSGSGTTTSGSGTKTTSSGSTGSGTKTTSSGSTTSGTKSSSKGSTSSGGKKGGTAAAGTAGAVVDGAGPVAGDGAVAPDDSPAAGSSQDGGKDGAAAGSDAADGNGDDNGDGTTTTAAGGGTSSTPGSGGSPGLERVSQTTGAIGPPPVVGAGILAALFAAAAFAYLFGFAKKKPSFRGRPSS